MKKEDQIPKRYIDPCDRTEFRTTLQYNDCAPVYSGMELDLKVLRAFAGGTKLISVR